jgi:hypothetical protein
MKLVRNSPEHIRAAAAIDTDFFWRLCDLREDFLAGNKAVLASELDEHPPWLAASAKLREDWAEALAELRKRLVDSTIA